MKGPHNIWRLIRTGATFERTGAMKIALDAMDAPRPVRIAARILGWPFSFLGLKGDPSMPPVVRAIHALGPAYIKFGQLMSTRPDIVGPELAQQLTILQDKLPPFPIEVAKTTIARELGAPVDNFFSRFDPPIAAASLAQVHQAQTQDGELVAVKVLRPGIERAFLRDVDAFHFGAWMVETLAPFARRLKPRDVIRHFEHVVRTELDLRLEASVGNEYAEKTQNDANFRVPEVKWALSARRVMTTSWVEGIALSDRQAILAAPINHKDFAAHIIQSFLRHALRDGLFHADMHQGNLKLGPDGALVALDFGIMGRIDPFTRRIYAEILYGFLQRDYTRVADVHFEAGYVSRDKDRDEFAQALRSIGEPIFGQDASKISMARLLAHLFEVTEAFGMETRTELILLQRTMVVVEGVARGIDPDVNMWEVARPVVETYIREQLGPKAALRDLKRTALVLARIAPDLPDMIENWRRERTTPPQPKPHIWRWVALASLAAFIAGLAIS